MNPIHKSTKIVKEIDELIGEKQFLLPSSFANERDPVTLKSCVMVGVNSKKTYLPVGEVIPISYEVFCVLKDVNILGSNQTYEVGGDFDPLRLW